MAYYSRVFRWFLIKIELVGYSEFRICVFFSEIDPKNPKILKLNFQALHARMHQWIIYHCIHLTAFIRFKFCKILINVYRVLLEKISILSKILVFFSMAKIEILKPHISDHRHTICLKFQIWVDDVMINIYMRFKEKRSMMKFPASHLKGSRWDLLLFCATLKI